MKARYIPLLALMLAAPEASLRAQGIINGGFELYDSTTTFLLGWSVRNYDGTGKIGTVDNGVAGSLVPFGVQASQGFYATMYGKEADPGGLPIGNYYLFARGLGTSAIVAEQLVTIPEATRTLQYRALFGALGDVVVEVDGVRLESQVKTIVAAGGVHGVVSDWWIDMSGYTGQKVRLQVILGDVGVGIDEVRFSTEPIPEPAGYLVFALGCAGLPTLRRRKSAF
ncbi:MAG: hypothetical protein JNN07_05300 [Verrucomicrobiales bacterium]|nr:hypothetical protein [Verrucomicrobiales bacterium]